MGKIHRLGSCDIQPNTAQSQFKSTVMSPNHDNRHWCFHYVPCSSESMTFESCVATWYVFAIPWVEVRLGSLLLESRPLGCSSQNEIEYTFNYQSLYRLVAYTMRHTAVVRPSPDTPNRIEIMLSLQRFPPRF